MKTSKGSSSFQEKVFDRFPWFSTLLLAFWDCFFVHLIVLIVWFTTNDTTGYLGVMLGLCMHCKSSYSLFDFWQWWVPLVCPANHIRIKLGWTLFDSVGDLLVSGMGDICLHTSKGERPSREEFPVLAPDRFCERFIGIDPVPNAIYVDRLERSGSWLKIVTWIVSDSSSE